MDTTTGRFTSMDSYLGSVDDPVSLHKYLYANANPVNYIDPSGYYTLAELMETLGIQGVIDKIAFLNVNTYLLYINLENSVAGIIIKEVIQESIELAIEGDIDVLGIMYTSIEVLYGLAGSEKEISALRNINKNTKNNNVQTNSITKWGKEHGKGNIKHNNAIELELDIASNNGATDIRKNRVQRDVNGNRVYSNGNFMKPDASYIMNGVRYNTNYVSKYTLDNQMEINREFEAFKKMYNADPNAVNILILQY